MTQLIYHTHPDLYSCEAKVVSTGNDEKGNWVELDITILHVRGGGQMPDKGTIDGFCVQDVIHTPTGIRHYVDSQAFFLGQTVTLKVDEVDRAINARWHTAGHLVAGVLSEFFADFNADRSHQYPGEGWVGGDFSQTKESVNITTLNSRIEQAIQDELCITASGSPLRLVAIAGFDAIPCGGTHLENLSDLTECEITKVAVKKGRIKVSYKAN